MRELQPRYRPCGDRRYGGHFFSQGEADTDRTHVECGSGAVGEEVAAGL